MLITPLGSVLLTLVKRNLRSLMYVRVDDAKICYELKGDCFYSQRQADLDSLYS